MLMSKRIGMIYKLEPQRLQEIHSFDSVGANDIQDLAEAMLEAFRDTEDFNGETLEDFNEEINSVVEGTIGAFISEASFLIRKNTEIAGVILISLYKDKPLVSELFTRKKYMNLGIASSLLKKSINMLLSLGYEHLVLYVHPKNIQAINLYKKIGFIEL
jgi:ribosomal protein S18 acetylase RimI-like enzyme